MPTRSIEEHPIVNSVAMAKVGIKFISSRNLTIPITPNLSLFIINPPAIIPKTAAGIKTKPGKQHEIEISNKLNMIKSVLTNW